MWPNLKIETKFLLAFMLPILFLMTQGFFSYVTITNLAKESEFTHQTTITTLEKLKEQSKNYPAIQSVIDTRLVELEKSHEFRVATTRRMRMTLIIFFQVSMIMLILIGFFFAKHLRIYIEQEKHAEPSADIDDTRLLAEMLSDMLTGHSQKTGTSTSQLFQEIIPVVERKLREKED